MVAVPNLQGFQLTYKANLGNKFVPADPPDMLNYEGCQLLLISASDGLEKEWETNL
jgi:hypothetical protein